VTPPGLSALRCVRSRSQRKSKQWNVQWNVQWNGTGSERDMEVDREVREARDGKREEGGRE
jgi:hypothetical protein